MRENEEIESLKEQIKESKISGGVMTDELRSKTIEEWKYTLSWEIVCPYCGAEQVDSWESSLDLEDGDRGERTCDSCEKDFEFIVHRQTKYSSERKEDENDPR